MTAAEARRAYMKEWRAKNRDKVKASNERYWARKAKALEAAQKRQKTAENGKEE